MTNRFRNRIPLRSVLLWSAVALLAAITAIAQIPPGGGGGQMPASRQPYPTTTPDSNLPGTNPDLTSQQFSDKAFLTEVMEGNQAEVQLGQLAQQKSQSADVKQFGQKMVQDHTQLSEQIKPIAEKLGVSEPKGLPKKDRKLIAKLEALSGPQFDEEYIKAMVQDHSKTLKDFKSEAQSTQDTGLQQTVQADAKVIAQHLEMIQQIAQAHNVSIQASNKKE